MKNVTIDTSLIVPGNNDRTVFDQAKLTELAASIREHGLIQPITVRRLDTGDTLPLYQIVAGERRYRAVCLLGWPEIPANVVDLSDEEAAAVMLAENVARADLDPIDEAVAYQTRMDLYGWTVKDVAGRAGVSAVRVQFRLKLLTLRPEVQALVRSGNLPLGYAQVLSDAGLNSNFQAVALSALRDNPAPTPAWFRRVCGELAGKQNQVALFDLPMFGGELKTVAVTAENTNPPAPDTHEAPAVGETIIDIIRHQIEYWLTAAREWHSLGKPFKRQECQAAANALQMALKGVGYANS
jgi:ParB/RepB/Spo0J family partition protein